MKLVFPRVILGNRGDLASRWGVLRALHQLGAEDVAIFRRSAADLPPLPYRQLPYGRVRNLLPNAEGWRALRRADVAVWAVGLDLQDDSSLAKLIYLQLIFRLYRQLGLKVWCLFQGAGPLTTRRGRAIAAGVLRQVDTFVARDPGTYQLINAVAPGGAYRLAHDAIFLPGFEDDLATLDGPTRSWIEQIAPRDGRPLVGCNLRQWFHFSANLMPYQFAQDRYLARALPRMRQLVQAMQELVARLRREQHARVVLISAYEPGVVPWEDDLHWLHQVKIAFAADNEVMVIDNPLSLPAYFGLMAQLDLMIGMRLHSALIALRLGVPAINISYTLKGRDIMQHLGLADYVVDLETFINTPTVTSAQAAALLEQRTAAAQVRVAVDQAIAANMQVLQDCTSLTQAKPH